MTSTEDSTEDDVYLDIIIVGGGTAGEAHSAKVQTKATHTR